jgi:hypothetical protein
LSGLGRWNETANAAHRVMDLAASLGFGRRWDEGAGLRCDVAWGRDFEECVAWCSRMLESSVRRNDSQAMCWGYLRLAEVQVARGDLESVEEHLARAEGLVGELGLPEQLRALAVRAYVLLAQSRTAEALLAADQGAERVAKAGPVHNYCIGSYALLAEVSVAANARALGRDASLRARAKRDCVALGKAARIFPIARPRHFLHEGTRLWISGRRRLAVDFWKRGRAAAAALDIPHEEALLALKLARYAPGAERSGGDTARWRGVLARLGVREEAIERALD